MIFFEKIFIKGSESIKETMSVIDHGALGLAILINEKKCLCGIVTDGDIRRALIKGIDVNSPVKEIINYQPIFLKNNILNKKIDRFIPIEIALRIPVVNELNEVIDINLFYTDSNNNPILIPIVKNNNPKINKVLITGGAGYVGSILSRRLLKNGYRVTILDNLTYGDHGIRDIKDNKFIFIKGDCRNISDLTNAISGVDAVIHLAAIVGDPASALNPRQTIETNYLATTTLAQACKFNQINRFLFISTCSVYGAQSGKDKITENHPLNPVSLYAQTKIKSEEGIMALTDKNFSPTIFRFATLFGNSPRMRFDLAINVLSAKAFLNKKIEIFGGEQYRPFLHVADAATACHAWLELSLNQVGNQIFNVGFSEQNLKIKEVGEIIKKILPDTEIITNNNLSDQRDYNVSFAKFSNTFSPDSPKTISLSVKEIANLIAFEKITDITAGRFNNYEQLRHSTI